MSEYNWKPVLRCTFELHCDITFERIAKFEAGGVMLRFNVLPNLDVATLNTSISKKVWENKIVAFVTQTAAKLTGLRPDDFMLQASWGVGQSLTVSTLKKPIKLAEGLSYKS